MSQQQFYGDGGSPSFSGIETVTGNDSVAVGGAGSPVNLNLVGDTVQGVSITNTAANTETVTVADATTTQKGVVTLPTQNIAINYTNVTNAMSPYAAISTDYFISVDCSAGPVTINLPNTTTSLREFVIKDRTGFANTNNITVTTVGGIVTIDGSPSYLFTDAYESLEMLFNGTTYETF